MMNRIEQTFSKLSEQNRTALVTFIMAGDPNLQDSAKTLENLPSAGADIIELGMPFTDPAADGLSIQKAGQRALAAGGNMKNTLSMVSAFRTKNNDTPIILMGYANPIFSYGFEKFSKDAQSAGVDGLIIVDLPPEEDNVLRQLAKENGIDMIRLVTPTTTGPRLDKVLDGASGFLYYVSITGVTGTAKADLNALEPHIEEIKSKSGLPIAIGFGIKTPEDAKNMAKLGDGVVVGSAIVDKMKDIEKAGHQPVLDFVQKLSDAL